MERAQELLYTWFKEVDEVRYERIKQMCEYLNIKFGLVLGKPIYDIFYPLLYTGVVEFAGDGKFHIAPECCISKTNNLHILLNSNVVENSEQISVVGIQICKNSETHNCQNRYHFNLESILGNIPSIENCVLSFQEIYNASIVNFENSQGVSRKKNDSSRWYFIDSMRNRYYIIPHQSANPDALNIAFCYDRFIRQDCNGIYNFNHKELKMNMYHMPILIYRALMIESVFGGSMPYTDNGYYVFKNISRRAYFELNRIFCKSIKANYK